jgi:iron-sulfur cluster repair protein YtfE (RIC family)
MFSHASRDRSPWLGIAFGALAALLASRLAPPLAGRAGGSLLARAGRDIFASLARDHRLVLGLIAAMEATPDSARARRTAMLLQLKRMLAAHAMAEEDVLYPMLSQDAGREAAVEKLYHEHADMKVGLFALEHIPKNAPEWRRRLRALRTLIASHARQEEEQEFPRLRAALAPRDAARLAGEIQREKSMLL